MNEEKKEDEIEPLGESKNNMEEVVSKKKKKKHKKKALEVNDWDTCKIAKNQIDTLRDKVRAIDVGYLGFRKDEGGLVDVGTEPIEEEKDNVIQ